MTSNIISTANLSYQIKENERITGFLQGRNKKYLQKFIQDTSMDVEDTGTDGRVILKQL
jgi:hypothetical protein